MKKLITLITAGAFAFIGTTVDVEARHYGGGYNNGGNAIYVSGYHHGRPVYTQRYIVGRDCHGHPVYRYRTVSAPHHRSYQNNNGYCAPNYGSNYRSSHVSRSNYGHSRSSYHSSRSHRSGSRVSVRFGF